MNNAISEFKNTLEATNSRITEAEDRMGELEDRMVEINESERKKEKQIKRNEDNLRDLHYCTICCLQSVFDLIYCIIHYILTLFYFF